MAPETTLKRVGRKRRHRFCLCYPFLAGVGGRWTVKSFMRAYWECRPVGFLSKKKINLHPKCCQLEVLTH